MVIYIANSMKEVEESNYTLPCVVIEDNSAGDRFMYFLSILKLVEPDKFSLAHIDPFDDVVISIEQTSELAEVCKEALDPELLSFYSYEFTYSKYRVDLDEAVLEIRELLQLAEEALRQGKGLVSSGD